MLKEVRRIPCVDIGGSDFEVIESVRLMKANFLNRGTVNASDPRTYHLTTGKRVDPVDEDTFKVIGTEVVLKRQRSYDWA